MPYLVDAYLVLFGVLNLPSPIHAALVALLAPNEMVLAMWLRAKGFRAPLPALTAQLADPATSRPASQRSA